MFSRVVIRCYAINVVEKRLLTESAILIEAGMGKEDRLAGGSYVALRRQEEAERRAAQQQNKPAATDGFFVPE